MWITPILTLMLLPKKAYSSTIDSIGYVDISPTAKYQKVHIIGTWKRFCLNFSGLNLKCK